MADLVEGAEYDLDVPELILDILQKAFPHELAFIRALRVSEPCICMRTYSVMLEAKKVETVTTNGYDIDPELKEFHEVASFKFGAEDGDLFDVALDDIEDSDGLVCGAVSKGFSAAGNRLAADDVRSNVYVKIVEWIVKMAKKGCLKWFAVENSDGVLKRLNGNEPFVKRILMELLTEIPFFALDVNVVQSKFKCEAMSRIRPWVSGLRRDFLIDNFMPEIQTRLSFKKDIFLFLNETLTNVTGPELSTAQRQKNLEDYEQHIKTFKAHYMSIGKVAFFELDRSWGAKSTPQVLVDTCPSIRTRRQSVFMISIADIEKPPHQRRINRLASLSERFLFQCFRADYARVSGKTASNRCAGNAFPVPMAAAITWPLICLIEKSGGVVALRQNRIVGTEDHMKEILKLGLPDWVSPEAEVDRLIKKALAQLASIKQVDPDHWVRWRPITEHDHVGVETAAQQPAYDAEQASASAPFPSSSSKDTVPSPVVDQNPPALKRQKAQRRFLIAW